MRFKKLLVVALACSLVGIAWLAVAELRQLESGAKGDLSCDHVLESEATEAWLAAAFDLARVPGDPMTPPLERMLADDPDVFVPEYAAGSYEAQIDTLRDGALMVLPRRPQQPLGNIDWSVEDLGHYYATALHGWGGLANLLGSQERLPHDVEGAIAFVIRDWFHCNGAPPGASIDAWDEGTLVKRLSAILLAIDYYRAHGGLGDLRFVDLLYLAATNKDALMVAKPMVGNHGLRQEIMLMSVIGNLPYLADRDEVRQLVERRLNAIDEEMFSREGIWKEHAPGYVHYALRQLTDLDRVAKDGVWGSDLPILAHAESTADYLRQILTPDGELPPIGGSKRSEITPEVAKRWDIDLGEMPYLKDRSAVFKDYGEAVYSSAEGGHLYVLFQAVQNLPAGKRDADELSFVVHNHGRWWLVDSGHYTNQRTPARKFLASARAHNTYIRGGRGVRAAEKPELDVLLTGFSDENGLWRVRGRSDRFFDGASLEREVAIDKASERIDVRDRFNAPAGSEDTWRGFLHFAPDLDLTLEGSAVIARDPASGREMRIALQGAEKLRIVAGQDHPFQGWVVHGRELVEAPVLEFETKGEQEVGMTIAWQGGAPCSRASTTQARTGRALQDHLCDCALF